MAAVLGRLREHEVGALNGLMTRSHLRSGLLPGTLQQLQETEFNCADLDKIFACAWLDSERFIVGTKCYRLVVIDARTGQQHEVPLPSRSPSSQGGIPTDSRAGGVTPPQQQPWAGDVLPQQQQPWADSALPQQPPALAAVPASAGSGSGRDLHPRTPGANSGVERLEPAASPAATADGASGGRRTQQHPSWREAGIRALATTCDGSLLAVGARENDCVVLSLPDFRPLHVLTGHEHWVFGASFLTEELLVTGSRDGSVKLWDCRGRGWPRCSTREVATGRLDEGKVRDIKADGLDSRLVTLSMSGAVDLWDVATMKVVRSEGLRHADEPVCLALDGDMVAAGSLESIALLDVRCPPSNNGGCRSGSSGFGGPSNGSQARGCCPTTPLKGRARGGGRGSGVAGGGLELEAVSDGNGVRSLSVQGQLLTAGHSNGQVAFYDLRTLQPLQPTVRGSPHRLNHLSTGRGWSPYGGSGPGSPYSPPSPYSYNGSHEVHACLSHDWDVTRTRLLTAGGPIHPNLRGCYIGVWN